MHAERLFSIRSGLKANCISSPHYPASGAIIGAAFLSKYYGPIVNEMTRPEILDLSAEYR